MIIEVMLQFFSLEGNPLYVWGSCIAVGYESEYCILREETMRERRKSYNGCVVGCIPSFCWIIIKEGAGNFSGGRSPHWVNHVNLCLSCIVCLLCLFVSAFVLFYCSVVLFFLTHLSSVHIIAIDSHNTSQKETSILSLFLSSCQAYFLGLIFCEVFHEVWRYLLLYFLVPLSMG